MERKSVCVFPLAAADEAAALPYLKVFAWFWVQQQIVRFEMFSFPTQSETVSRARWRSALPSESLAEGGAPAVHLRAWLSERSEFQAAVA